MAKVTKKSWVKKEATVKVWRCTGLLQDLELESVFAISTIWKLASSSSPRVNMAF
jgi:hypothetical protein